MGVPDSFGVDDDHWTVAALIEAAGLVNADLLFQSVFRNVFTQSVANLDTALIGTCFAGRANKNVFLKDFHSAPFPVVILGSNRTFNY
jgi:hypothetical protein